MNGRTVCVMGAAMWLCTAAAASAQDKGDAGLSVSAPQAIGIIWHASERLALRPDVTFGFSETDGEGVGLDVSSKSFGVGISLLLYTRRWDDLRLYVSPRFTYSRASSDVDNSLDGADSTFSGWGLAGSVGGQYALGTRFGVFAEAGLSFASQESETASIFTTNRSTWSFGTRTAIGGILYF
jgi:hypothetical protein